MSASIPELDVGPTCTNATPGHVRQRWFDNEGRLIASGGSTGGRWWMHWGGLATYWFGDSGNVIAEPVETALVHDVRDAFLRGVTPVVLLARGFEALHASGVLHPRGVIAFCGSSGTGKSTLALALATRGLPYFADDTVVYRPTAAPGPSAVALPSDVRVDSSARFAVGTLPDDVRTGVARPSEAPIHRIYHLVRDVSVKPNTPSFAHIEISRRFQRLLAHAHPFDMGSDERRRAFFENLMVMAAKVDLWECRFAPDLEALPSLAARIEEHAFLP